MIAIQNGQYLPAASLSLDCAGMCGNQCAKQEMQVQSENQVTLEAAKKNLPNVDEVIRQLSTKAPCKEWSKERLECAKEEYLRYLTICKLHPGIGLTPSHDVDEVWHRHILNTKQYAEDCQKYFGYFLHHEPCTPTTSFDPDIKSRTERIYWETFGEAARVMGADCTSISCSDTACKT